MEKIFVCDVPENQVADFQGIFEKKSTLESLALLIANNNDIMERESTIYERLVQDYKECMVAYDKFWSFYLEKYGYMLEEGTQLSLDFKTKKIYVIPIE